MSYFLDTYALIEISKGNKNYERFLEEELFTSFYNLYEFYFILLKNFNEKIAKDIFNEFKSRIIALKEEYIFEASKFKLTHIKKKLSYVDCLGYAIALEHNIKFLTGDKEFERFENVEFVK